jgi:hypothetical protein
MASKKATNHSPVRKGKLLGGYVPAAVARAVGDWVSRAPERDLSTFVREAAREKLRNEGIPFNEKQRMSA